MTGGMRGVMGRGEGGVTGGMRGIMRGGERVGW